MLYNVLIIFTSEDLEICFGELSSSFPVSVMYF